jgi:hypothetical protein
MQKVEGSSPFIRFKRNPRKRGGFVVSRGELRAAAGPIVRIYSGPRPDVDGRGADRREDAPARSCEPISGPSERSRSLLQLDRQLQAKAELEQLDELSGQPTEDGQTWRERRMAELTGGGDLAQTRDRLARELGGGRRGRLRRRGA